STGGVLICQMFRSRRGLEPTVHRRGRSTNMQKHRLEEAQQLVLESNALLREARKSLEASLKVIAMKETWHRADPEALAEALRQLHNWLEQNQSQTNDPASEEAMNAGRYALAPAAGRPDTL